MSPALPNTRRIAIDTDDLSALTRIDRRAEVDPRGVGLSPEAVEQIWQAMGDMYRTRVYPALTFCLRRQGRIVLNRSIGYARGLAPERPLAPDARRAEPDTPVCIFSASKSVVAALVHKLAEEGGIDLDAPVSRYVPAFSGQGKSRTTIAQILAHPAASRFLPPTGTVRSCWRTGMPVSSVSVRCPPSVEVSAWSITPLPVVSSWAR